MIALSISSGYLIDSNYSEHSHYILDSEENFLVFVICDETEDSSFSVAEIVSREFCKSVYNNRYITNLKNLIEVGIHDAVGAVEKFINHKNIDKEKVNLSISGGVFRNGLLMLFSIGNSPIFVIDDEYRLFCPFELSEKFSLFNWKSSIKFKEIKNPRSVIACSNKLNGKLFKFKNKNGKLIAEPFKYRIIKLINMIIQNKDKLNEIKEEIKEQLNLNDKIPLFVSCFKDELIDEGLVKVGLSSTSVDKKTDLTLNTGKNTSNNNLSRTYLNYINYNIINHINNKSMLVVILLIVLLFGAGLLIFETFHNGDKGDLTPHTANLSNISQNDCGFNNSGDEGNFSEVDALKDGCIEVNKNDNKNSENNENNEGNKADETKDLPRITIYAKFGLKELKKGRNILPISISFPERGVYYIAINSKTEKINLLNVDGGNVIFKNDSSIILLEEITNLKNTYNLIVNSDLTASPNDVLTITISEIKIDEKT